MGLRASRGAVPEDQASLDEARQWNRQAAESNRERKQEEKKERLHKVERR